MIVSPQQVLLWFETILGIDVDEGGLWVPENGQWRLGYGKGVTSVGPWEPSLSRA